MNNVNKKKTVYKGSAEMWAKMMNSIYGPVCKFKPKDYLNKPAYE